LSECGFFGVQFVILYFEWGFFAYVGVVSGYSNCLDKDNGKLNAMALVNYSGMVKLGGFFEVGKVSTKMRTKKGGKNPKKVDNMVGIVDNND